MGAAPNNQSPSSLRCDLLTLLQEAVGRVMPERVMPAVLPFPAGGRLIVIAIGKAAAEMMRIAQMRRGSCNIEGLVVTRHGHIPATGASWPNVDIIEAGHPYPDENSILAGTRTLELAGSLGSEDRLLVLLSGGGSALLAAPAEGLDLEQKQNVTRALLRSGARIDEINCVRKHLSRIKGGRLAAAAFPAEVLTWIISDVPGDNPSFVASGPTVADDTSLEDARKVLAKYAIHPSAAVRVALENPANETPDKGSPSLARSETLILACAADALGAACESAAALGYEVTYLGDRLEIEARALGKAHADLARASYSSGRNRAIISGGETTVTVVNKNGRGGRNLEYLLSLALALEGARGIHALACDTDGIDGTDDAAGAIIGPDTLERGRAMGMDPEEYLSSNNAYPYFAALGDLVITGPSLTNVNDFRVILIDGEEDFSS